MKTHTVNVFILIYPNNAYCTAANEHKSDLPVDVAISSNINHTAQ